LKATPLWAGVQRPVYPARDGQRGIVS